MNRKNTRIKVDGTFLINHNDIVFVVRLSSFRHTILNENRWNYLGAYLHSFWGSFEGAGLIFQSKRRRIEKMFNELKAFSILQSTGRVPWGPKVLSGWCCWVPIDMLGIGEASITCSKDYDLLCKQKHWLYLRHSSKYYKTWKPFLEELRNQCRLGRRVRSEPLNWGTRKLNIDSWLAEAPTFRQLPTK